MDALDIALAFIRKREGLRLKAYRDSAGIWTIGYGRIGPDIQENSTCTEEEAEAWLVEEVRERMHKVKEYIHVQLSNNELAALTSLIFNVGEGAIGEGKTISRLLNAGDRMGAADAFLLWGKANVGGILQVVQGLHARRLAEKQLFLKKD